MHLHTHTRIYTHAPTHAHIHTHIYRLNIYVYVRIEHLHINIEHISSSWLEINIDGDSAPHGGKEGGTYTFTYDKADILRNFFCTLMVRCTQEPDACRACDTGVSRWNPIMVTVDATVRSGYAVSCPPDSVIISFLLPFVGEIPQRVDSRPFLGRSSRGRGSVGASSELLHNPIHVFLHRLQSPSRLSLFPSEPPPEVLHNARITSCFLRGRDMPMACRV